MALTDERKPYEILIRFGAGGAPKGAHVQYRRVVTLDGEVLKDEPEAAVPLGVTEFPTGAIMADVTAAALAEVNRLRAEAERLEAELAACRDAAETRRSQMSSGGPLPADEA